MKKLKSTNKNLQILSIAALIVFLNISLYNCSGSDANNCQYYRIGIVDSSWFSGYYFISAYNDSHKEVFILSKRNSLINFSDNNYEMLSGGKTFKLCLNKLDTCLEVHSRYQDDPGILLDSLIIYSEGRIRVDVYESINITDKYYIKSFNLKQ